MNTNTQSVSVIMPVYKGTEINHAKEALQSIENQTVTPDELIIIVDGPVNITYLKKYFFLKNIRRLIQKY